MNYFDPVSLRLFVAICEEQSLTAAADRVSCTTSAVSKRLAQLERQVGAPLLSRSRRGVTLTAAGEAMLPAARSLLQSMTRIQARLSDYALNVKGHVRVAATMSPISSFLPGDLAAFGRRHGNVHVSLEDRMGVDVVSGVEDGSIDLGICWDAANTRRLQTTPYRADHLVAIVPKDHELAQRKRISFAETLPFKRVVIQGGSIVPLPQQRMAVAEGEALRDYVQVRNYDASCRIVAAGLAIAIVPKETCRPLARALGLKMIPLTDEWTFRRFVVCSRDPEELSAPVRLLLEMLGAQWYEGAAPAAGR